MLDPFVPVVEIMAIRLASFVIAYGLSGIRGRSPQGSWQALVGRNLWCLSASGDVTGSMMRFSR